MTNEVEKQFFGTFGIEPKLTFYDLTRLKEATNQEIGGRCSANWQGETKEETIRRFSPKGWKVLECKDVYIYPQITDHILLELICIHNQYSHPFSIYGEKKEFLKNDILECMINILNYFYEHEMGEYSKLKYQVRELFEEG